MNKTFRKSQFLIMFFVILLVGQSPEAAAKSMDPTCMASLPLEVMDSARKVTKETVDSVHQAARGGDVMAQMTLALLYLDGAIVKANLQTALSWAEKASTNERIDTRDLQLFIKRFLEDLADPPDQDEQLRRTAKYAEQGSLFMQYTYAEMLNSAATLQESAAWYEKAAAQGCMDARAKLSRMQNLHTRAGRVQAYKWISLTNYEPLRERWTQDDLGIDENRVRNLQAEIRRRMHKSEIGEAETLARSWASEHGEQYLLHDWPDEFIVYSIPENFQAQIKGTSGYLLMHFTSFDSNCKPCISSNEKIDALSQSYRGQVRFVRFNHEPWWKKNDLLSGTYRVHGFPTMVLYRDGVEQARWLGDVRALEKKLESCCASGK